MDKDGNNKDGDDGFKEEEFYLEQGDSDGIDWEDWRKFKRLTVDARSFGRKPQKKEKPYFAS
jgi:hypothetical protein